MNFKKAYLGVFVIFMGAFYISDVSGVGSKGEREGEKEENLLGRRSASQRSSESSESPASKRGRRVEDPPFLVRGDDGHVYVRGFGHGDNFVDDVKGSVYGNLSSIPSIQWDHSLTPHDVTLLADGMAINLRTLNLRNADLTRQMVRILGDVFFHRPLLRDLRIDQQTSLGVLELVRALSYCPALTDVEVGSSDCDDTALQAFLRLAHQRSLVTLEVGYNISSKGLGSLWTFLDTKPEPLKEISLWISGDFRPSDFDPLPRILLNYPALKLSFMFMSGSRMDGKVLRERESLPNRKYLDFLEKQYPRNVEFSYL